MKPSITLTALAALTLGTTALATELASLPNTPLGAAAIVHKLAGEGYSHIREIELDDGRYEVEAVAADGQIVIFDVDPLSGARSAPLPRGRKANFDREMLPTSDLVRHLERQGWRDLIEMEQEGNQYIATVRNDEGTLAVLEVDPYDGALHKHR